MPDETLFAPGNVAKLVGILVTTVGLTVSGILWLMSGRIDTIVVAEELKLVRERQMEHHKRPTHEGTPDLIRQIVDKEVSQSEKAINTQIDAIREEQRLRHEWEKQRWAELYRRLP